MRSFALAIAAVMLLASCSDDPEPIEPTDSPSSQPSAAPVLPSKAEKETPDGAIAFVAHWIETFNFAVNTGAIDPFIALNRPTCGGCKSYEDQIIKSNRDSAEVRSFKWVGGKSNLREDRTLEATIRARDYEVRDSAAEKWAQVRGSTFKLGFDLSWGDERWQVDELYVPDSR
jgi:hypothetical protein